MTEPLLEYTRGIGWHYHQPVKLERCGTLVLFEYRTPQPGERFDYTTLGFDWLEETGQTYEQWLIKNHRFDESCKAGYGEDYEAGQWSKRRLVVITKVG